MGEGNSWYFLSDGSMKEYLTQSNSSDWLLASTTLYVNSFYFGCTTLTTVGYGDFKPFSENDRVLFCFVLAFGILIYTMIFDQIKERTHQVKETPMIQIMKENQEQQIFLEDLMIDATSKIQT